MTCDECREVMLVADAEELRGVGASPVAEHLRICATCKVIAARLLDEQLRMASAFMAATPRITAEEMARVARAEAGASGVISIESGRRRIARLRVWGMISVAAAAVLVVMVVDHRKTEQTEVSESANIGPDLPDSEPNLEVEVPEGRNAIIMNTRDPKISVVWIY